MNFHQELQRERARFISRRWFLRDCGVGLAGLMLNSMKGSAANITGLSPSLLPNFAPKAKRLIYMFQAGGPSQFELFDPKPELTKMDGKLPPAGLLEGYRAAFINPNSSLLGVKAKFTKHGDAGMDFN